MTIDEVYQFFGTAMKASEALGITRQAFTKWRKIGYIPIDRQRKLERITKGALIAREENIENKNEINQDSLNLFMKEIDELNRICDQTKRILNKLKCTINRKHFS